MEQRPDGSLLLLRLLQSWPPCEPAKGVEEGRPDPGGHSGCPHLGVHYGLLCLSKCKDRRALQEVQAGL